MKTLIVAVALILTGCCGGAIDTIKCDPMPKHDAYRLLPRF